MSTAKKANKMTQQKQRARTEIVAQIAAVDGEIHKASERLTALAKEKEKLAQKLFDIGR
ncbi:MAG: hypothetical protein V1902_00070 [Candidatus Falkowbacteria bacterium]